MPYCSFVRLEPTEFRLTFPANSDYFFIFVWIRGHLTALKILF